MLQVKASLLATGAFDEGVPLHITSGLGAGFFAVVCGSPVDVVKSRMMGAAHPGSWHTSLTDPSDVGKPKLLRPQHVGCCGVAPPCTRPALVAGRLGKHAVACPPQWAKHSLLS